MSGLLQTAAPAGRARPQLAVRGSLPRGIGLLEAAPWLADGLNDQEIRRARSLRARVAMHDAGCWSFTTVLEPPGLGLLVLGGFAVRTVKIDGSRAAELLGAGDLLRPSSGDDPTASIVRETEWAILSPLLVAVLDGDFAYGLRPFPGVTANLFEAALRRAHSLNVYRAGAHSVRVERRLELLLWHFADRWGHVCHEGTVIQLPHLTHELLGQMVGARRPSVSTALGRLERTGIVRHEDDRWILLQRGTAA